MPDLVATVGDVHHIFPKAYLQQELGASKGLYNQVANYACLEKRMNIAIGKRAPRDYFGEARDACAAGASYFGDAETPAQLAACMEANCIPAGVFTMTASDYERFLVERRQLIARKVRAYFEGL